MEIKFIKTRKDLSVWIIACFWLAINTVGILLWGIETLIFTNPVVLLVLTGWVVYTKLNPDIDKWLEEKL